MYCEVYPSDCSYPAVEHIKPKDKFPSLVLEWDNLGWACTTCNTKKSNYWSGHADLRILNPFEDEPDDHLTHLGPLIVANDSGRGVNTIRKLRLNRNDLLTSRAAAIEQVEILLELWRQQNDPDKKQVFAEELEHAAAPDCEFSASIVAYLKVRGYSHEERNSPEKES